MIGHNDGHSGISKWFVHKIHVLRLRWAMRRHGRMERALHEHHLETGE